MSIWYDVESEPKVRGYCATCDEPYEVGEHECSDCGRIVCGNCICRNTIGQSLCEECPGALCRWHPESLVVWEFKVNPKYPYNKRWVWRLPDNFGEKLCPQRDSMKN